MQGNGGEENCLGPRGEKYPAGGPTAERRCEMEQTLERWM